MQRPGAKCIFNRVKSPVKDVRDTVRVTALVRIDHPAGIRRRYDVEIWLKIGRQRDINVILTSFCERWFNISIQTSKQRRYSVRRFDLKFRPIFNVGLTSSFG